MSMTKITNNYLFSEQRIKITTYRKNNNKQDLYKNDCLINKSFFILPERIRIFKFFKKNYFKYHGKGYD